MGRPKTEKARMLLTNENLRKMYLDERKSIHQIEVITGLNHGTVHYWMKKYDIPRRTLSESEQGDLNCWFGITGKNHPLYGQNNPYFGVKGKDHPTYLSRLGSNNHMWKGGITPEDILFKKSAEYRNWRKQVFSRDNYTCQSCKVTKLLNAHHILSFTVHPELRVDIDNGITLCKPCHKLVHSHKLSLPEYQEAANG